MNPGVFTWTYDYMAHAVSLGNNRERIFHLVWAWGYPQRVN